MPAVMEDLGGRSSVICILGFRRDREALRLRSVAPCSALLGRKPAYLASELAKQVAINEHSWAALPDAMLRLPKHRGNNHDLAGQVPQPDQAWHRARGHQGPALAMLAADAVNGRLDLWSSATFDGNLLRLLRGKADLIINYFSAARRLFVEREASDHRGLPGNNPYAGDFDDFLRLLADELGSRSIRAWHYTRLVDREVSRALLSGIELSTPASFLARISRLVDASLLSEKTACAIIQGSPFNSEQLAGRADRFWATSNPVAAHDSGVALLLRYWGGEVSYFFQEDGAILRRLGQIGRPRIFELEVPLAATNKTYSAARSIASTFSAYMGEKGDVDGVDLDVIRPLPPSAIIAVHTKGDRGFREISALASKSADPC